MRGGPRRTLLLLLLLGVGGLSLGGCGSTDETTSAAEPAPTTTTTTPTTTTTTAAPATCPASGALVTHGLVDSAMGVRTMALMLRNCGSVPYEVNGYPGIQLLEDQQPIEGVEVVQGSGIMEDPGPTPLVLAPGETAVSNLSWRNRVESPTAHPIPTAVAVTPRPADPAQVIPSQVDIGTTARVEITAWHESPDPQ